MFRNLDHACVKVARNEGLSDEAIREKILDLGATSYVAESSENGFKAGMQFKSFHYQAKHRISDRGLVAGIPNALAQEVHCTLTSERGHCH